MMKWKISLINLKSLFFQIGSELKDLNHNIEVCPFCKKFYSMILFCLICKWKCCEECHSHLNNHNLIYHQPGITYIKANTGEIFSYFKGKRLCRPSLF
jgi:hypothetical protein